MPSKGTRLALLNQNYRTAGGAIDALLTGQTTDYQANNPALTALSTLATVGLLAMTSTAQAITSRTLTAGSTRVAIAAGNGSTANPSVDVNAFPSTYLSDTAVIVRNNSTAGSTFAGALSVPDAAYSSTGWDGSLEVPTKNAVRDKFESLSAGSTSSGSTLLEQHSASASATLDFTTAISTTYDEYLIELVSVIPSSNGVTLYMRMSTNAGSSYDAGANYSYVVTGFNRFGVGQNGADSGATEIQLNKSVADNTATAGVNGHIRLFNPSSTSVHKNITGQLNVLTGGTLETQQASGWYRSTTAVNAFRFLFSSGNITSGTIRAYGIAK